MSHGRPAFLFPGQGSQSIGMGKDLYDRSPAARRVLDRAQEAAGFDLLGLCFEGPDDVLTRTEFQQPCILAVSIAALEAMRERIDVHPPAAIGHSLGEYSALVASGSLDLADAVRLTRKRGAFMQEAVPQGVGGMAALLGAEVRLAEEICSRTGAEVWVANINGAGQVILSGKLDALAAACELAKTQGVRRTSMLPVSAPFHSPLMKPAAFRLQAELEQTHFGEMSFPVIANVDAQPNSDAALLRDLLFRQVTSRVLFESSVRKAVEMGADSFVEIGPGGKLTAMVRRIVPAVACCTVASAEDAEKFAADWRSE